MVLEGLFLALFEPIDLVEENFLTFKMAFLLATFFKRVGGLQALSVSHSCLEFAPEGESHYLPLAGLCAQGVN